MLNPTSLLADALGQNLAETYRRSYGDQEPHIAAGLDEIARLGGHACLSGPVGHE